MKNSPTAVAQAEPNPPRALRTLRWTLLLLVVELTFEGLMRKMSISGANIAIFLLKDVIIAAMGVQILKLRRPREIDFLWLAYVVTMVLFLPCILMTAGNDPLLAVFGAKQYLLYPVVAFGVYLGFEHSSIQEIVRFYRWLALLVLPTALVAIIQLRLPTNHWLNLSVDGSSLEGFSAAGHLRVSSTFPFVAQYCAFIAAEVFIVMIALNTLKDVKMIWKPFYLATVPLLLISSYITGSRGAVLSCIVIILIGAALSMMKFQGRAVVRLGLIIGGLLLLLGFSRMVFPDAFAAYAEREQGHVLGASTEIQERIYSSMFDWMNDIFTTPFFGNGLGIMSNGSDMLSNYASLTRQFIWTETDFATTLFEGGIYLIVVWYGFRYYVILRTVRCFLAMKGQDLFLPNAFCVGFVVLTGLTGTLAIQPPIAIWWWLAVGTSLIIWRKSLDPKVSPDLPPTAPGVAAVTPKARGRSTYAERLHAQGR